MTKEAFTKKDLQAQYKEREIVGGICAIRNKLNHKLLLEATVDLQGYKNRFAFAQKTGSCIHMKLQNDWAAQGAGQFDIEVLEELVKGDTQSPEEFKADILTLKDLWLAQLANENFY